MSSNKQVIATFHDALKILDASEETMRSMIENDLMDVCGPNANTPKSAAAVKALMAKITVVRTKAIRDAFKHLRATLPYTD
jgi:hypothetical protein